MSILTTFEMNLDEQKTGYKSRNVALKSSSTTVSESTSLSDCTFEQNEDFELDESNANLDLLTKKFNSLIKD